MQQLEEIKEYIAEARSLKDVQNGIDALFELLQNVKKYDRDNYEIVDKINAEIEFTIDMLNEPYSTERENNQNIVKMAINKILGDYNTLVVGCVSGFACALGMYLAIHSKLNCEKN
jgi:hypothetical protein